MNKSLELVASQESKEKVLIMPNDMPMPYPMHALVINYQPEEQPKLERCLSSARNLIWSSANNLTMQEPDNKHEQNVMLLVLPNDEAQASTILKTAASYNIDIILLSHETPQSVLRLAFQHGVSDIIRLGAPGSELLEAVINIAKKLERNAELAPVLAIVNGKGGSGASFIATSLAEIATIEENNETALIDSDLHYGTLAHMLGVKPSYFITDALDSLDQLDSIALKSAMVSKDKIHLLASRPFSRLTNDKAISPEKFKQLAWKCRKQYSQVIIDLSRGLEPWNISILEGADILLVVQQNVMSITETNALIEQLTVVMGLSRKRIHLLINRYQKSGIDITLNDIKQSTGIDSVWTVTNDFKNASQCTDLSISIVEVAKHRPIFKDLKAVTSHFFPQSAEDKASSSSIWSRFFGQKS